MSAADTLRQARAIIADPARWTQGGWARNASGDFVDSMSRQAVCWCAWAALNKPKASFNDWDMAVWTFQEVVGGYIAEWNDTPSRTHAEVLAAFDKAIEIAERGK